MMPPPQFRLRSLFIITAIVAVGCLVGRLAMIDASAFAFGTLVFRVAVIQAAFAAIDRAAPPKN